MTATGGIPEGLRMIQANATCSMAEFERCIATVWKRQPTREAFDIRHAALVDLAAKYPGNCGYIELIEPESKPPSDDMRKIAVEAFRKLGKDLTCVAFVLEGPELRSALVRAILTTMMFLLPQMQPSKVFKRLTDMVAWVRPRLGHDPGFDSRLLAVFDYLRSASST